MKHIHRRSWVLLSSILSDCDLGLQNDTFQNLHIQRCIWYLYIWEYWKCFDNLRIWMQVSRSQGRLLWRNITICNTQFWNIDQATELCDLPLNIQATELSDLPSNIQPNSKVLQYIMIGLASPNVVCVFKCVFFYYWWYVLLLCVHQTFIFFLLLLSNLCHPVKGHSVKLMWNLFYLSVEVHQ